MESTRILNILLRLNPVFYTKPGEGPLQIMGHKSISTDLMLSYMPFRINTPPLTINRINATGNEIIFEFEFIYIL
jgi:hypothetical protein